MPVTEVRESQMLIITITRKGCLSCAVKFITRYMALVRRVLFFTKRIIDRRFTVTISNSYGKVHSKPCAALG